MYNCGKLFSDESTSIQFSEGAVSDWQKTTFVDSELFLKLMFLNVFIFALAFNYDVNIYAYFELCNNIQRNIFNALN